MDYLQYFTCTTTTRTDRRPVKVLNLIINGLPSILSIRDEAVKEAVVLNLIINGLPSIQGSQLQLHFYVQTVLNLIINGLPSILNTIDPETIERYAEVLNLIINGLPSIPKNRTSLYTTKMKF